MPLSPAPALAPANILLPLPVEVPDDTVLAPKGFALPLSALPKALLPLPAPNDGTPAPNTAEEAPSALPNKPAKVLDEDISEEPGVALLATDDATELPNIPQLVPLLDSPNITEADDGAAF